MSQVVERTVSPVSDDEAFREIIEREFPTLEGRQSPEVMFSAGPGDRTHGDKAIELARRFGLKLMPWQREQVHLALSTDEDGRWLHQDVVLICPRQNGKSLILEVIILYRFFILNNKIIFTAHQWKTAKSIRNRLWKRIKNRAWAARKLEAKNGGRNTASAGEAEMETGDGGKIQFTTRSADAGRGFDEIDLLLLDEAYNLEAGELDAITPIQLAAQDPQTYYTSSAVNAEKQVKGVELSRVRKRALEGETDGMLYSEFRAPDGLDPDDPETWKLGNPSYGVVATEKKIRSLKTKLTPKGFHVEVLGWGDWFSIGDSAAETIIDLERWEALADATPALSGDSCLAADVTPDGLRVGVVAALSRADGGVHLSLNPAREFDRVDVVSSVVKTVEMNDPVAVVLDPKGPASTLIDPLTKLGVEPEELSWPQVSAATELFMRLVHEGKISHDDSPRWVEALEVAAFRGGGEGGRALTRKGGVVCELVAATFAVWGLVEYAIPEQAPDVKRKTKFVGRPEIVPAVPAMATMSF
ncbi:hypothetical protein [Corynebacterium sp. AOP12-C2-36]|uniref:hypothetical protein n=1 Tax=Corynebacterium sp. AOP12-C2-36 TaxID=3457723 RepID=UPI004034120F